MSITGPNYTNYNEPQKIPEEFKDAYKPPSWISSGKTPLIDQERWQGFLKKGEITLDDLKAYLKEKGADLSEEEIAQYHEHLSKKLSEEIKFEKNLPKPFT